MKVGWNTFKAFWTAEEVPRWFGFSLVFLYLIGLGAVGQFGIVQVREEARAHFESSSRYATKALAAQLSTVLEGAVLDGATMSIALNDLHDFSAHIPLRWARVVDGNRRVIVSTNATQVGKVASPAGVAWVNPKRVEATEVFVEGQASPDLLIRTPIIVDTREGIPRKVGARKDSRISPDSRTRASEQASTGQSAPANSSARSAKNVLYLEVCLLPESHEATALADQSGTLIVVLVAFGVLFGLYRCLRAQLRGVTRIAGRLRANRNRIEQALASLRIADAADAAEGMDSVTSAWNELVDLAQNLLETVNRTEANEELTRVLERSSGGALAEALNAIPDGLIYITDEVRFEYLNATVCRLFGWNAQEAKRGTLPEAQAHGVGSAALEILRDALRPDGSFEARTVVVEAGDDDMTDHSSYRVWVIPLNRAHREGECLAIIRDVSQQIRAERAREEFVAQVTHELRTPLTNIRAYAETLSSGMFEDPKVITECYNVITKETRRLSRLIEDILSVSQLEVGSIELHVDNVDLKTLLTESVRDVRGLADEKDIDIQLQLPAKMEPIRGDRDKLAVIINNLLGNAIKYTQPDGDVVVGCQLTGDAVVLTFKDNGIGIDPTDHARVFEKFQRGDDPEVQNETGTGIGLYTAREIARRHGGDIELISTKGEGSTFMVRLPHRETRATALSTAEET